MNVIGELSQYLGVLESEVWQMMVLREVIVNLEHKVFTTNYAVPSFTDKNPLEFYQNSRFMMFSNAMDELERNHDTDWDDMFLTLEENGLDVTSIANKSVLDFGAGIGSVGLKFAPFADVSFYEPNIYSMEFLRWRLDYRNVSPASLSRYPHTVPDKFDLITAWGVFEHLDDDTAADTFQFLLYKLAPGGKIFLKNFYTQTDEYLLHFEKGTKMKALYKEHDDKIIYACHSD